MDRGTSYVETEAILAAQEADTETLEALVTDMLPGERRRLAEACKRLERHLLNRCTVCDGRIVMTREDPDAERWWSDSSGQFHERCNVPRRSHEH